VTFTIPNMGQFSVTAGKKREMGYIWDVISMFKVCFLMLDIAKECLRTP
jgi:hypothetical protein